MIHVILWHHQNFQLDPLSTGWFCNWCLVSLNPTREWPPSSVKVIPCLSFIKHGRCLFSKNPTSRRWLRPHPPPWWLVTQMNLKRCLIIHQHATQIMVENGIQTMEILERIATTLVVMITQALAREALVAGVKVAVAAIAGVDSSSPRTTLGL